jgi:hypothetical protein
LEWLANLEATNIMAIKKHKGKPCVYCAGMRLADTDEHIFARTFFATAYRHNLPKVPACRECNNEKSKLEHYLATVLPFGARNEDAVIYWRDNIPRRLAKNEKLCKQLASGAKRMWIKAGDSLYVPGTSFPIDGAKITALFAFIVKGLMWHHWETLVGADTDVMVTAVTGYEHNIIERGFALNAENRVDRQSLGGDTFIYEGLQGVDNHQVSLWKFSIYNGLITLGVGKEEQCSYFAAFSGPKRISEKLERIQNERFAARSHHVPVFLPYPGAGRENALPLLFKLPKF